VFCANLPLVTVYRPNNVPMTATNGVIANEHRED
jgi:hypothetical protein